MDKDKEYSYHEPTQSPINPPYKQACELRKQDLLAKPSTKPQLMSSTPMVTFTAATKCDLKPQDNLGASLFTSDNSLGGDSTLVSVSGAASKDDQKSKDNVGGSLFSPDFLGGDAALHKAPSFAVSQGVGGAAVGEDLSSFEEDEEIVAEVSFQDIDTVGEEEEFLEGIATIDVNKS